MSLTSPLEGARFGLKAGQPTQITLTAEASDMAGTLTNVSFYNGSTLIGSDSTAPYSVVWSNVGAGNFNITAMATLSTGQTATSPVTKITVDNYTVPVTTGLACHFDASVGVITDVFGSVKSWSDRSGNAHHATVASGAPMLVPNQILTQPVVRFSDNSSWLNVAGKFFTKEQYVVVRSPTSTWSGPGSFLGRKSDDFLTVRSSSYNLAINTVGFWQDHYPAAVSKNGISLAENSTNGSAFDLTPITDFMVLKITVDASASAANLAQYPYYQIGRNETLNSMKFDVAEIIGYTTALSASDEVLVGGYLEAKYGIATAYPATGSIVNMPASAITSNSATINGTLLCNGGNYDVVAYWGPVDGGLNPASWANSASIGSWSNVASVNISRTLINFVPGSTSYCTFRATNATQTIWSPASQSFTTSTAYASWAGSQNFTPGVNDNPNDDPDRDGMINKAEFAFGLNPTNGASLNPFADLSELRKGKFKYTRRAGTGLNYTIHYSLNLADWLASVPLSHVLSSTNGDVETWTVELSPATIAEAVNGKLSLRVQAN